MAEETIEYELPEISVSNEPELELPERAGTVAPVSDKAADRRAFSVKFGVPELERSQQEVKEQIAKGDEPKLREELASELNYKKAVKRRQDLIDAANRNSAELANEAIKTVPMYDPFTVVERKFAEKATEVLDEIGTRSETVVSEAQKENPKVVEALKARSSDAITMQQIARKTLEDVEEILKHQSWPGFIGDVAKQAIPGYYEYNLRGNIKGVSPIEGITLGNNLQAQANALLKLPVEEFKQALEKAVAELSSGALGGNPLLAKNFVEYVVGKSSSEQLVDDVFSTLDIVGVGSLVRTGLRIPKMLGGLKDEVEVAKAFKDVVKAAADPEVTKDKLLSAAGDASEAAVEKVSTKLIKNFEGKDTAIKDTIDALPSGFRADREDLIFNPGRAGDEVTSKIVEAYENLETNLIDLMNRAIKVERIAAPLASKTIASDLKDAAREMYKGLRNHIMEVSKPYRNDVTNVYQFDMALGRDSTQLFKSKAQALQWAELNGLPKTVEQQGVGYYIRVTKPLDETMDLIRDGQTSTKNAETPNSLLKGWIEWLVTPDNVLSKEQRMNRKAATYAQSLYEGLFKAEAEPIKKLAKFRNKGLWKDWERVVLAGQDLYDVQTKSKGYFFKSVGELEDYYQATLKRLPENVETEAYFAFKRITEMDRVLRNIQVFRNKSRIGTELHKISFRDATGAKVESPEFDGVMKRVFPGGEGTIAEITADGNTIFHRLQHMSPQVLEDLKRKFDQGNIRLVELFDPEARPLKGFSKITENERVRYVISQNLESKPIPFWQIPRRGGGHIEYEYDFYIKQAKIRPELIKSEGKTSIYKSWYEGDTTIFGVMNRAMGKKMASELEAIRKLLKNGDKDAAKAYANKNLPAIEWSEIHSWFNPKVVNGERQPPRLSLDEPIQVVPKNKLISDIGPEETSGLTLKDRVGNTFEDGTQRGSLARSNQVPFTSERDTEDFRAVVDKGSLGNPLFDLETAKTVDPMSMMNRAMSRIIDSTLLEDYKIYSVENWLKQAEKYMKEDVWDAPYYYFYNPVWSKGVSQDIINNLNGQNFQIRQFLGIQNKTSATLHASAQRLSDYVYNTRGPGSKLDPIWMLSKTADPVQFMRSVAFETTMGLFAIPQLFVQMNTYVNIFGVAGARYALPGTFGALLHGYTAVNRNPNILAHMDKLAAKMGFKPGEWKEAYEALHSTGFKNVAGEYVVRDTQLEHKMLTTPVRQAGRTFLDWGHIPFTAGEKSVRIGAWYTAFRRFREQNPTGRITNDNLREILEDADLLAVNMSRASASRMHTGIMSVPAQFYSYPLRAAELFLSKRLGDTTLERTLVRARIMGYYAGVYGIPTAMAGAGLPVTDSIRKYALDNGYVVGDNFLKSVAMEGIPAAIVAFISGGGDPSKGYWPNIGDRYGSHGLEWIQDLWTGDEPLWNIFGGAAQSKLSGLWESTDGFRAFGMSFIRDDDKYFQLKADDFVAPLKEISASQAWMRGYVALNTGRWLSKKGILLEDEVSPLRSVLQSLTGLQSQAASDAYRLSQMTQDREKVQKYTYSLFAREWRKGLQALRDENYEQANEYMKRGRAWLIIGGYPEEKMGSAVALASRDNVSLIKSIKWNFYFRDVPPEKRSQFLDAFQRDYKLRGEE